MNKADTDRLIADCVDMVSNGETKMDEYCRTLRETTIRISTLIDNIEHTIIHGTSARQRDKQAD